MATFLTFTRADAPRFSKLLNWLFDLPRYPTHVGSACVGLVPATVPNPPPLRAFGWTTRHRSWVAKPSNTGAATDEFAVRLTSEIADAWQAKKSQLTAGQRNWVQAHIDVASNIELLAAWKRAVRDPDGKTSQQVIEADDVEPEK